MYFVKFLLVLCFVSFINAKKVWEPFPDPDDIVRMARYIVKSTKWVAMSTISTHKPIEGYPFATLKSMSDGTTENSTGIPYFYMTDMDLSASDLLKDNRVTIMCSLEENYYCKAVDLDPQSPRCPKVMITGKYIKLKKNTEEYNFGKNALFYKHPEMKKWPGEHQFYVAKIDIEKILILDNFGGARDVPLKDYIRGYSKKQSQPFLDLIRVYVVNHLH